MGSTLAKQTGMKGKDQMGVWPQAPTLPVRFATIIKEFVQFAASNWLVCRLITVYNYVLCPEIFIDIPIVQLPSLQPYRSTIFTLLNLSTKPF
jgi:hypothetical protein